MLSVIIPTINRTAELTKTLQSIILQTKLPEEVVIVDQSEVRSARNVAMTFKELINIVYIYSARKSSSGARNIGIQNSKGSVVCMLDDDVVLDRNYFEKALAFFENYPDALGVQGIIENFEHGYLNKVGGNRIYLILYNLFAAVFLLNRAGMVNRFLPSARIVYCKHAEAVSSCQWLSGCSIYRRKVFGDLKFRFDENMIRYCYGEDKLFSYEVYKKFPKSLYVDPSIRYEHYPCLEGRLPSSDLIKSRILYNYYIWHKVVNRTTMNKLLFYWSSIGDLMLYLAKGWDWFNTAARVYFDIWFKKKNDVFVKYKDMFNFSEGP